MVANVLFLKPQIGPQSQNIVRDFIYGCWCNGKRIGGMQMPPLNDLYAATHSRQDGVKVDFLDAQMEPDRFKKLFKDRFQGIKIVAIMGSTQSFRDDVRTFRQIKDLNPGVCSILYGSHPTFMPQYCLSEECVDFIAMHEPEETIRELIRVILAGGGAKEVLGIGYREKDGEIRINTPRPYLDMDNLPIPDRSLLPPGADYFNPVVKRLPYTTMQTSRGCPGRCIFCTAPNFYGHQFRFRSMENTLEELRQVKQLGFQEVFFRDETFTAKKFHNLKLCEAILSEGIDLSWIANARVDMIDKETMKLMKKAGCHMLKFGVESGDQQILQNYLKGTTLEQAEKAFREAREVGLETHAHIVFGGPGETRETIKKTISFVKKLRPTTASFGILTPYPGTPLFEMVAAKNPEIRDGSESNMNNLHITGFFSEAICGLSGQELSRWIVKAYRSFYLRPGFLLSRLFSIKSIEEFIILTIAGLNVLHFSLTGRQ